MGRLSVRPIRQCVTLIVMIMAAGAIGHAAAEAVAPGAVPSVSTFTWHVSAHAAPSWSAFSDPVIHVVAFVARHRFSLMPLLICGSILLGIILGRRRSKGGRKSKKAWLLIPLGVGLAVCNLIFGTAVSGALIFHFGAEGQATITASHATGDVYNNHDVRRYDVLVKKADGAVVHVGFEDDDFNVYPSHKETIYPGAGDQFNVRYLQRFPQDFVILREDDSPWAHEMRCERLGDARAEADERLKFASDQPSYRTAANTAARAEAAAGCTQ
jgi:hypothetical protein